ncbi:relaxase/mobilization nuclease domain-containing protein [Arcicella sp. LKC2W]|uniref:relaxase/mobilization nuclease domain-containing protein n=1 Tax=Arcicella sp. LKC2W TaxID=2984198 RepID=UPI002B20361F|nr:relaxase/mobilization nuclease domain-containing protein [Arcicella sp. LKC2W]MEA5461647.1 relaxase/mobilization nuclease domain-containing protein [Arcicella sp. LKC2W]
MVVVVSEKGKSFKNLFNYLFEGRLKDRQSVDKKPEIIIFSDNIRVPFGKEDKKGRARLVDDIISQCEQHESFDRKSRLVGEHILSFSQDETAKLSKEQIGKICEQYVKDAKLDKTQYVAISHGDTDNLHVHLVFNRVQNDVTIYPEWKEKVKASERAIAIGLKFRLHLTEKQSNMAQSKGVFEVRVQHDDILALREQEQFNKIRNLKHLEKVAEKSGTTCCIDGESVKIDDKIYFKNDLEAVFYLNRKIQFAESQEKYYTQNQNTGYGKNPKKIPAYQRKKEKINADEFGKSDNELRKESKVNTETEEIQPIYIQNPSETYQDFARRKVWGKDDDDTLIRRRKRRYLK